MSHSLGHVFVNVDDKAPTHAQLLATDINDAFSRLIDALEVSTEELDALSDEVDVLSAAGYLAAASQAEQEAGSSTTAGVTPGRQQFHPSAAKGWVRWDAATANIESYNVTSLTDNSAGDTTITWATDFSNDEYGVLWSTDVAIGVDNNGARVGNIAAIAAGTVRIVINLAGGAAEDQGYVFVAGFGDQ